MSSVITDLQVFIVFLFESLFEVLQPLFAKSSFGKPFTEDLGVDKSELGYLVFGLIEFFGQMITGSLDLLG